MLYAGRLAHEQKGIFFLPEVLAGVRAKGISATLTVIGEGPDGHELHRRLAQTCEPETFAMHPSASSEEIYRSLLTHHVLLMPSFYEGLPIIPLEAQACGCVPIASNLPGVTDVGIEDGTTGFLCPLADVAAFVDACTRAASSPGLWKKMSQAAHDHVAEKFTTDIMAAQYVELFTMLQRKSAARPMRRLRAPRFNMSVFGWRGLVPNGLRGLMRSFENANR
jgi:glycosyltransferase involved in cell wall biosynthesis